MNKIITFFSRLLGGTSAPEQPVPSVSAQEVSLRFLAELQQCCAALPKGRAEVVFADHEFHICMQWQEGATELPQSDSPKALAFWINGENTDVDYQEMDWPSVEDSGLQTADNEGNMLKGDEVVKAKAAETVAPADASVASAVTTHVQPDGDSAPAAAQESLRPASEKYVSVQIAGNEEVTLKDENEKPTLHQRALDRLAAFMATHYAFRYNILHSCTEYVKLENGQAVGDYAPVDYLVLNSISMRVIRTGIPCNDHDVKRYVASADIPQYHPFQDYLNHLPAWDGIDRVTPLARRVASTELWISGFHKWMLAMTAQWMGMRSGGNRANSVAPILVSSSQGMGKSTFCRLLLPAELQSFYTDQFNMEIGAAFEHRLSAFGLVNLDEFDRLSNKRMAQLKSIMQMVDLDYRPAYSRNSIHVPRIASFIGTSNRHDLITDVTGSRRFLCVEVEEEIDCITPIAYEQLYAQLKQELADGERFWFTKEDERAIQANNQPFCAVSPAEELLRDCLVFADSKVEGFNFYSATTLYALLKKRYGCVLRDSSPSAFSKLLPNIGTRVHTQFGNGYWVKFVGEWI